MKTKRIGALLGAGILALTLAGPVFAQDGHPTPVSNTDVTVDCTGGPGGADITPGAGQVVWIFVHSNPDSTSGVLTAVYTSAGTKQATSYIQGGVKYLIVTNGADTITSFSDTITGGQLVLSHVCYGPTTTTTTTSSTTTKQTTTGQTTTTETTTAQSETTGTTTAGTTTAQSETTGSTTSGTTSVSSETTGTTTAGTTTAGSTTTATSTTRSGTVEGEIGAPTVTPPATDALASSSSGTASGAWGLVLGLGVVLSLSILVLTPLAKSRRRK